MNPPIDRPSISTGFLIPNTSIKLAVSLANCCIDGALIPADPLFWMHHANIDRIYTLWQNAHPDNPNTIPRLSGSDLNMDP